MVKIVDFILLMFFMWLRVRIIVEEWCMIVGGLCLWVWWLNYLFIFVMVGDVIYLLIFKWLEIKIFCLLFSEVIIGEWKKYYLVFLEKRYWCLFCVVIGIRFCRFCGNRIECGVFMRWRFCLKILICWIVELSGRGLSFFVILVFVM